MTDVREETAALLDERPELAADLEALLEIDEDGPWTFDDVPLDSGTFGEIVSRGIVEKEEGEYRVADREAVRAGIGGDRNVEWDGDENASGPVSGIGALRRRLTSKVTVDRRVVAILGLALLFVAAVRLFTLPAVYRGDDVVLSANDPYFYRYLVETLLATPGFDPSRLLDLERSFLTRGEPLMVITLWAVSLALGGTPAVAGHVLAWYPVVAAVLTAAVLYVSTTRVSGDRRVGLAAAFFLAVTPLHVTRTSLGFADHHAFDGLWLAVTLLGLVWTLPGAIRPAPSVRTHDRRAAERTEASDGTRWVASAVLAVGVAGQVLSWEAAPLLLVPLLGTAVLSIVSRHRVKRGPSDHLPLLVGVAGGGVLSVGAYVLFDWHRPVIVSAPLVIAAVGTGALGASVAFRRAGLSARALLGTLTAVGLLGGGLLTVVPEFTAGLSFLIGTRGVSETTSLVSDQLGFALGPVLLFGFALAFALPYLAWWTWTAAKEHRPRYLAVVVYTWYFLVLSFVQFRFGDLLAIPAAILAGMGLVRFAAWINVANPPAADREAERPQREPVGTDGGVKSLPVPERRDFLSYGFVLLFAGGPGLVLSPIRANLATIDTKDYRVAKWIEADADDRRLDYPSNYVLSQWGRNRLYNYFVNGESLTYSFAREQFEGFLSSADPAGFYAEFGDRIGYVVTATRPTGDLPPDIVYRRLHQRYGSAGEERDAPGVGHYQVAFAVAGGSRKVFRVVPGATLTGSVTAGSTVSVRTSVDVGAETVQYVRRTTAGDDGEFTVRVAHSGEYGVETDDGATGTVDVPETAVYEGNGVEIGDVA